MGKLPGFYASVTASLRDFCGSFMTSLPLVCHTLQRQGSRKYPTRGRGDMRLKDRVVIVTGAARGLGQAYCLALAREGAHIVAADMLSCAETVAQVQQAG